MTLPEMISPLFHNYDPETIDPERHAGLVIRTVLAAGTWEQVRWLFRHYGFDRVRTIVLADCRGLRTLPEPTQRLWSLVFAGNGGTGEGDGVGAADEDPLARWRWRRRGYPAPTFKDF